MDELNRDLLVAVLAMLTDAIPRHAPVRGAEGVGQGPAADPGRRSCVRDGSIDRNASRPSIAWPTAHLKTPRERPSPLLGCVERHGSDAGGPDGDRRRGVEDDARGDARLGGRPSPADAADAGARRDDHVARDRGRRAGRAPAVERGGERFQLIRPHAKGGIGQVWVARDGELQRDVALKEIQTAFAEREDQRARFVLEAEITGNLEHPGIVPVYSLGRNADGPAVLRDAVHPRREPVGRRSGGFTSAGAAREAGGRLASRCGASSSGSCSGGSSTSATRSTTPTAAACSTAT